MSVAQKKLTRDVGERDGKYVCPLNVGVVLGTNVVGDRVVGIAVGRLEGECVGARTGDLLG